MRKAYLTIDDTPSERTDELLDFLHERNIPALLFLRGDRFEHNPAPVMRAIEMGFAIGNHTYSHRRASEEDALDTMDDILRCETLIEEAYRRAGRTRACKPFRFSYLDRGTGAWVVDFEHIAPQLRAQMEPVFWEGLNFCDLQKPDAAAFEKKKTLQDFLKSEGFEVPFKNVSHEWYAQTEIASALDCFFTYSTSDWMLTRRHLEKNWPYKTLESLRDKIDQDPFLKNEESTHVILAHDQPEIVGTACALVEHLISRGFEFLDF